ncbi:MAG: response regulator [Pleomorphochaeta sp.]
MVHHIYKNRFILLILIFGLFILGNINADDTNKKVKFTEEELDYIEQSPILTVGLKPDRFVMSYFKEDEGFGGLNYNIMESISKISGLDFDYVSLLPKKTRAQSLIDKDCDLAIAFFDYDKQQESSGLLFSKSFMENSFELIIKKTEDFSTDSRFSIAVPASANSLLNFINEQFPLAEVVFTSADERAENVLKGDVDATIIGRYEANYILQMPRYRSLTSYPTNIVLGDNSIGLSSTKDPILVDIIDKSIDYMMENEFSKIFAESIVMKRYEYTFYDMLISQNDKILMIVLAISIILLLIFRFRNKHIQRLKKSAEVANQAKTEFISRMSHDMRTPLGTIINLTEFGISETSESIALDYFKSIKNSSEYLLSIVNDVLDIQRIEEKNIILEEKPILFNNLITSVNQIIKPLAEEQGLVYKCNVSNELMNEIIQIDQVQSKKILVNLLSNSIKFTPKGGAVSLSVEKVDEDDLTVKLLYKIEDNGIGMSENFQQKMYEPFEIERDDSQALHIGTGLGLSITKYLIEKMGGYISCISEKNVGTTFFIEIRYNKASESMSLSESDINKDCIKKLLKGKKVLVCEDHALNQMIIKKLLSDQGLFVDIADNGLKGVKMVNDTAYDLILMDIRMPVMDGYTATKEIKKINQNVPIIGLSADASLSDFKKASLSPLDAYISKPIDKEVFYLTICEVFLKKESSS